MNRAWIDLDPADVRTLLVSLIGYRFGERPEERIAEIRTERQDYARSFLNLAAVTRQQTVLDLGSGCGFGTAEIARRARSVLACDISAAFLEFAGRECGDLGNVRFHHIEPRKLTAVAGQSVDTVISMSVFIHLNLYDMYAYFKEFRRVLKPGGKVVFDFADAHKLFSRFHRHGNGDLFREHAEYYREDPSALAGLVQWNSARAITLVAREAGFRRLHKRGQKLLFRHR
jgi:ubiquinone/menaquinone biosynthesis C-methylase UbiE